MQDVNVVVVFQSSLGSTERLALAAAVGAVQGRANIRLRWLADETFDSLPEWNENRERMSREYIAPRQTDAEWAHAILAGMPERLNSLSPEFQRYFESLERLRADGKLAAKAGAAFAKGAAAECLHAALARLNLDLVPLATEQDELAAARMQGRRTADLARTLPGISAGTRI